MSKIYEALLRAELERTGVAPEPEEDSPRGLREALLKQEPQSRPEIEIATVFEPQIPAPETATVATPAVITAPEIGSVGTRRWTPLFASLPALGDGGPEVEQFRSLRSHILEFREQKPMRSVIVSSGLPGEGKSYIAINLALSFARHRGNRVLLIDGDMRRSTLHKLLGAPFEPGLTEFLSGAASLDEVMQRAEGIELTPGLASLTFISGGKDAEMAGDLAANARFGQLIQAASPRFDWIIVDSSPVNLVSDAVSLAHSCDGVLLVGREGVTKFKTAQAAQAQFKSANVLGFVLNDVRKLPAKSDYYGTYDSYSGYKGYKAEA